MQFEARKRLKLSDNDENGCQYPFWTNFYISPPTYKISLQEVEDITTERLKILQVVDNFMKSLDNSKRNKQFFEVLISQINAVKMNNDKNFYAAGRSSEVTPNVFEARKRDHISHFLLRIFYCQTEELRKWFISRETELFKVRLSESNSLTLKQCLTYYGYKYEIISTDQLDELHDKINWMESNKGNLSSVAFKLHFEEALDLVRNRKVYLFEGYAYIAASEMISVFCNQFRLNLSRELAKMHTNFYSFGEPRLVARLESLHNAYISNTKNTVAQNTDSKNRVTCDMIEDQSKELFPPCMRSIHENLRKEHHLKHYGRLHYGLFLKSIGVSLEDSINFFRSEFSIKNPEKFQKEYSYTIRYIYGKEGKRVQLSAYSCQKIMNENAPGPTDSHGCPFRHFDSKNLKTLLIRYGINEEAALNEILSLVANDKNYSGACTKFFSLKYSSLPKSGTIYHPNQYYNDARNALYAPQVVNNDLTNVDNDLNVTISGDTTIGSVIDESILDETLDDILNETI